MTETKKTGRPPRKSLAQTSARSTFTVRLRGSVRAALIEASENSGRSISEELECRLEQSFTAEDVVARLDRIERMLERVPQTPSQRGVHDAALPPIPGAVRVPGGWAAANPGWQDHGLF